MTRLLVAVWDRIPVPWQNRVFDLAPAVGQRLDELAGQADRKRAEEARRA